MVELARRAAPEADVRLAALPDLPFADAEFDAVVANFVLNHVGRPKDTLAELRRVVRPGGWIALTIWAAPPAAGQRLIGRAIQAAGAVRPPHLPAGLAAEDDFHRDESGLTGLLEAGHLREAECGTLRWDHRASPEEWWSGPAGGVAFGGQLVRSQTPQVQKEITRHFDALSTEFAAEDGLLSLPHAALLARARHLRRPRATPLEAMGVCQCRPPHCPRACYGPHGPAPRTSSGAGRRHRPLGRPGADPPDDRRAVARGRSPGVPGAQAGRIGDTPDLLLRRARRQTRTTAARRAPQSRTLASCGRSCRAW